MNRLLVCLIAPVGALALSLALTGCNTMEGVGEDVSAAGGALSGSSRDVQNDAGKKPAETQAQQEARAQQP